MGIRSLYDPRDPWAFRNTWTGEIRNSYDDLWIWIPLIVGISFVAFALLIPILIHRYCRDACLCGNWCRWFDRILLVCRTMESDRQQKSRYRKKQKRLKDRMNATPFEITNDMKRELKTRCRVKKYISDTDVDHINDPKCGRTISVELKNGQFYNPPNICSRSSSVPLKSCKKGKMINRTSSLIRSQHNFINQQLIGSGSHEYEIPPIKLHKI